MYYARHQWGQKKICKFLLSYLRVLIFDCVEKIYTGEKFICQNNTTGIVNVK